jgi:hypothetical protein
MLITEILIFHAPQILSWVAYVWKREEDLEMFFMRLLASFCLQQYSHI